MDFVRVGFITGSHGLDGMVRIAPNTDNPQVYNDMQYLMTSENGKIKGSYEIVFMQQHGNAVLAQLKGIETKAQADLLKGLDIVIPAHQLPETDEDEIYWHKIENSEVVDTDGNYIGRLTDYMETGASDVFIITEGEKTWMISNNEHHVLKIDQANKRIIIDKAGLVSEEI